MQHNAMLIDYSPALQALSDRLLGLSIDAVHTGIAESLEDLGRLTSASRVYVFLLTEDGTALDRAFEWCDEGVPGHDFSSFRGVPVTAFPWSMHQFLRGETIYVREASGLPLEADAERGACTALRIGAYVNVPLFLGRKMVGWLGFDVDNPRPSWEDQDLELMRTAGRMLIFTIDRIKRDNDLRAEQALSRRLTTLGVFSAGLSHEVNNPLAYVALNLQLLDRRIQALGGDDKALQYLQDCREGVEQISQTVETLRALSRGSSVDRVALHVGGAIDSTLRLMRTKLELKADVVQDTDLDAWVEAAPSELGQVFANVLQNAIEALPEGRASDNSVRIQARRVDDSVVVEFQDSGPGFPEEALGHLFEPFFTTRSATGGSGVGLALCHRIVTDLGGAIRAENLATGGALVRISLPLAAPPSGGPDAPHVQAPTVRRRILVVDDVAPLRRAMCSLLDEHDVHEAADGFSAIAILRADSHWDLILCDVLMPSGSGRDVYEFVASEVPSLLERIVFTTGGGDQPAADFLHSIPNRVLEKPIEPDALRDLVAGFVPCGS